MLPQNVSDKRFLSPTAVESLAECFSNIDESVIIHALKEITITNLDTADPEFQYCLREEPIGGKDSFSRISKKSSWYDW